ncbi:hypothetical protein [Noviherbaspirillum massiliense]|uniref:hypothetical protein n=1 Tax=Noviherbaspirillum massiliense TaxID=1465823 RepID=UPI000317217A|nr:hypothetical protein [Noviherbaspirillum massiliense]
MSGHSLEEERQAILTRMQATRENYRRMLTDEPDLNADGTHQAYSSVLRWAPRSGAMRLLTQHPIACAVAVAALVAIGPRRIARGVARSGTTITNLTVRNQANIAMLTSVISMITDVMQRGGPRNPH